jgi:hypothetical protein
MIVIAIKHFRFHRCNAACWHREVACGMGAMGLGPPAMPPAAPRGHMIAAPSLPRIPSLSHRPRSALLFLGIQYRRAQCRAMALARLHEVETPAVGRGTRRHGLLDPLCDLLCEGILCTFCIRLACDGRFDDKICTGGASHTGVSVVAGELEIESRMCVCLRSVCAVCRGAERRTAFSELLLISPLRLWLSIGFFQLAETLCIGGTRACSAIADGAGTWLWRRARAYLRHW